MTQVSINITRGNFCTSINPSNCSISQQIAGIRLNYFLCRWSIFTHPVSNFGIKAVPGGTRMRSLPQPYALRISTGSSMWPTDMRGKGYVWMTHATRVSPYFPPIEQIADFPAKLDQVEDKLRETEGQAIVSGDFNVSLVGNGIERRQRAPYPGDGSQIGST